MDVVGIFHGYNPSGRTMALGLIQPLTEISTRNISWQGKGSRCVGLTTLPPSCDDCLEIWEPQPSATHQGLSTPYMDYFYLFSIYSLILVAMRFKTSVCGRLIFWGRGFESRWGYGFSSIVFAVKVAASEKDRSLFQKSPTGFVFVCVWL